MSDRPKTREPQYSILFDAIDKHGVSKLGVMVNESWNQDPRRTLFTLARYKFAAKMMSGRQRVLEIGCADAFGTRLVQQEAGHVTAVDFDPVFIADVNERMDPAWPMDCFVHDMLSGPVPGKFDGIYCIDVMEHVDPKDENTFMLNLVGSLDPAGAALIGIPSLESQAHASPASKVGHVNCKSGNALKGFLQSYFHNVFIFSMNDEVVHTGFYPMAHYLFALCTTPKNPSAAAQTRSPVLA